MRKSKSETAETRVRIVSTASRMLLDRGLAAVGMREVMAGADLTPGGFYRHFQSKEQLVAEATQQAFDRLIAMFEGEIIGKSPARALDRIVFVYLHQSQAKERFFLCPMAMLGAELRHCDATVRAVVIDGHQRLLRLIASQLTQRTRRDALATARGILSTMVGAVTLAEIVSDPQAAGVILKDAQALIKRLVASPPRRL